jgi:hypothetical protein
MCVLTFVMSYLRHVYFNAWLVCAPEFTILHKSINMFSLHFPEIRKCHICKRTHIICCKLRGESEI